MCGLSTHYINSNRIEDLSLQLYDLETEEQINNLLNIFSESSKSKMNYNSLQLDVDDSKSPISVEVPYYNYFVGSYLKKWLNTEKAIHLYPHLLGNSV